MSTTRDQIKAAFEVTRAVADTIRELGEVPSGHLYARMMGTMELHQYEQVIGVLKHAELVEETPAHLLRWIGPKKGGTSDA